MGYFAYTAHERSRVEVFVESSQICKGSHQDFNQIKYNFIANQSNLVGSFVCEVVALGPFSQVISTLELTPTMREERLRAGKRGIPGSRTRLPLF